MNFTEGLIVKYQEHTGTIRFISNNYLTLCIEQYDEKRRDVCMLIYRDDWDQIMLPYEDEK